MAVTTTTAQALRHVFVNSSEASARSPMLSPATSRRLFFLACFRPAWTTSAPPSPCPALPTPTPPPTLFRARHFSDWSATDRGPIREGVNEGIQSRYVQLVGADGRLQPEVPRDAVLQTLDRRKSDLVQVALSSDGGGDSAICRILDKAEQQARLKAARASEAALRRAQKDKGVNIGWSINAHDLAFKLEKLQAYLEKGYPVAVNFSWKRSKQGVSPRQRHQLLLAVAERVAQIPGVKELKREGEVNRGVFTIHYKIPKAEREARQGEESPDDNPENAETIGA